MLFTSNNQRLFADHYLNGRVLDSAEFATTPARPFAEAQAIWVAYSATRKAGEKEGEKEANWIWTKSPSSKPAPNTRMEKFRYVVSCTSIRHF